MSNSRFLPLAIAALLFNGVAHAGLWSSTNAVVKPGVTSVVTVSFTGDGDTTGAQVDIAVPTGFTVAATPLAGGACVVFPGTTTRPAVVRVITPVSTGPMPIAPISLCQIALRASAFADSGRFTMFHDECAEPIGGGARCELDPGFVTVNFP